MKTTKRGSWGAGRSLAALVFGHSMDVWAPGMDTQRSVTQHKGAADLSSGCENKTTSAPDQPLAWRGLGGLEDSDGCVGLPGRDHGSALPVGGLGLRTPVHGAYGSVCTPGKAFLPEPHLCLLSLEIKKTSNQVVSPVTAGCFGISPFAFNRRWGSVFSSAFPRCSWL